MQALERATAADKANKKNFGKATFQNKTGTFATVNGVENAGCKKGGEKAGKATFQNKTGVFATVNGVKNAGCRKGGNKRARGASGPRTTKAQTQANFEEFQRNYPEKLPEEARVEGFHYLELRKIGLRFLNASGRKVARVSLWEKQ